MRIWIVGALAVAVLAVAAWAFQPWRLWTSSTVDEPLPAATAPSTAPSSEVPPSAPPESPAESSPASDAPPQDVVLATGRFEDAEHGTTGSARILELGDGRRFLRLEKLATSDGPDLHVWLSDQPSGGDWGSYDDDRYVRLGKLKATNGNQNYEIPSGADLRDLRSVVIWCDRFNVAFGTAAVDLTKA